VDADEEIRRVLPAVRELAAAGVLVSVDTTRAAVAAAALDAGARIVNDVSGGLADAEMAKVVAAAEAPWVLMHWRGHSRHMQALARYGDVVTDVRVELSRQADAALAAGVEPDRIVLDPGLGFAKTAEHNWALLARLDELVALGFPVLVGASRKSFLGRLLAAPDGRPAPIEQREHATVAAGVLAAVMGAWGVRVHEVRPTADAMRVVSAWSEAAEHAAADEDVAGPPVPRPRGTDGG
jgi:dihydropteroate synthase